MAQAISKFVRPIFYSALCCAFLPSAASAVPIPLTLSDSPIFQQTDNSPCVIGNPSCSNPGGFAFTLIPANTDSAVLDSPDYSINEIRGIVGDTFYVGIDLQEPDSDYTLTSFTLTIAGIVAFEYTGGSIALQNHGNGFSDYVLGTFDLSPYAGTDTAFFTANFSDAQAAREQFFVASAPGTTDVPEPMTMGFVLTGLAATMLVRRRKSEV